MKKFLVLTSIMSLLIVTGCTSGNTEVKSSDNQNSQNQSSNGNTNTAGSDKNTTTSNNTGNSTGEAASSDKPMMNMEPQTPPALTEEQQKQFEAGKAAHEPTTLTYNVIGGNFYFAPNEIHVKKGDTVKIIFENAGGFHNFVLDEFNVKTENINGGEKATVEFLADKAGSFEYYCSVGKHRQMGQKGTLIVEE